MGKLFLWILPFVFLLSGCSGSYNKSVISNIDEREANEIVVFLASRGIKAVKLSMKSSTGIGESGPAMYSICVDEQDLTTAMAILNQNGLPRRKGTNLLELFAKQGLMTTEKEENIRYQTGLEQEMANMICKIDGIIDAQVKLSLPPENSGLGVSSGANPSVRVTAAVFVKHDGILDDQNSHLVSKIKRMVSGAFAGLDINDVTVITDKSRFVDSGNNVLGLVESNGKQPKTYAAIWNIVVAKESLVRFRVLFLSLIVSNIVFLGLLAWVIWKIYPIIKIKGGFQLFLNSVPLETNSQTSENE